MAEIDRRAAPQLALGEDAPAIAAAAHQVALRFFHGGKLLVFGAATDADHIAVEFLHPVIVGKQALPAVALAPALATFSHQVRHLADPGDIAIGVCSGSSEGEGRGADDAVVAGLAEARSMGLLTVALTGGTAPSLLAADHVIQARSDDPLVVKEIHVLAYHVLWELVHVFLEQPAALGPAVPAEPAACEGPVCITCSDQGVEVRVVALRPGDLAIVDTGEGHEEVSVALVDAHVGSRVLVHAKEAIALLPEEP